MSKIIFIVVSLSVSLTLASSKIQAVYGEDSRLDIYQIDDQKVVQAARATAAMIQKRFIDVNERQEFEITAGVYGEVQNLCMDEKFYNQPTAANCTTFLIEEDLLMTAGHCVKLLPCENFSFVFDFEMKNQNSAQLTFSKDQVYNCKNVERISLQDKVDYALIRLDRPVKDRKPLKLRSYGDLDSSDFLFLLGFPSGLPMKADLGQRLRQISKDKVYFTVDFDAFGANSGSPVINQKNFEVEGVLVRGEYDFEWDNVSNCRRVKKCPLGSCKGEDATIVSESMIYPQKAVATTNGCSAFLVNTEKPTVVTNGHCVGRIPFGVEWKDKKKDKEFVFYSVTGKDQVVLNSDKILYATMTNADIAILSLNHTWHELAEYGLSGLRIYPESLKENMEIQRLERYPTFSKYNCLVEKIIPKLVESQWSWVESFRHGCENWGGASGSPIIDRNSGLLVGIHNTANEEGKSCTENNPCEIYTDGQVMVYPGKGYGQSIEKLRSW